MSCSTRLAMLRVAAAGTRGRRRTRPAGGSAAGATLPQERVRHLDEDAGAVAGVDLAAARAAVLQVHQDLQRLLHDGVRLAALDVDDEADAAGVVLVHGVVETLRGAGCRVLGAGCAWEVENRRTAT